MGWTALRRDGLGTAPALLILNPVGVYQLVEWSVTGVLSCRKTVEPFMTGKPASQG